MISLDFDFNILTRDLSHYLENQVKVGLFGSGVGLSLVLGFSAAYTCYYLILVAKVRTFVCPVIMQVRLWGKRALSEGPPGRRVADAGFDYSASFPPASGCTGMCDGSSDSQMNVMLGISAVIPALNQPVPQENHNYVNIVTDKTGPTLLYNGSKSRKKGLCNAS